MKINTLESISPIDGRYHTKTSCLSQYFSEYALIKYRVLIEIEYFIALCNLSIPQLKKIPKTKFNKLRLIYTNFSLEDAERIKTIEKETNHDVKAVEYFLRDQLDNLNLSEFKEFIHFGLTSQDINNTAIPYSIRNAFEKIYLIEIEGLIEQLEKLAEQWIDIPMIARTHGQPASPTLLGKEIYVFIERIKKQKDGFKNICFSGKFGGATGNFNAHYIAYPNINWINFADDFCNNILGLKRQKTTTQIEHYDNIAALAQNIMRINTILIDFCRDIWTYISLDYFKQKIKKKEVGSSAMPHKVNPIDFENGEGNLGIANKIFGFLANKLPISRLQRDLTDSTVLRNIGVPFSHTLIAILSLKNGISKLLINQDAIDKDIERNWIVIAEAIQTILRREGYPNAYDEIKALTRRNKKITQKSIHAFIDAIDVKKDVKKELKKISPFNYTGKFKK
ncbi:MAG: adenylosuccinate lyase [Bacteroidota bacterium]|nr:adenylosuccinate lyase [Bacteroidota bacterium]